MRLSVLKITRRKSSGETNPLYIYPPPPHINMIFWLLCLFVIFSWTLSTTFSLDHPSETYHRVSATITTYIFRKFSSMIQMWINLSPSIDLVFSNLIYDGIYNLPLLTQPDYYTRKRKG